MRRDRIMVTVSPAMRAALVLLARRAGIVEATQATITLRQALDRTINSDECQRLLAQQESFSTVRQWRESRAADREVELMMPQEVPADAPTQATAQLPAPTAAAGRRGPRKVHPVAATTYAPAGDDWPLSPRDFDDDPTGGK